MLYPTRTVAIVKIRDGISWGYLVAEDRVKPFCKAFAELMARENPTRYLSTVRIADRRGKILVDWLRNGPGATAVASFCPRARPNATVATPLAWDEVRDGLDPKLFTLRTIPDRLAKLRDDPWDAFDRTRKPLPDLQPAPAKAEKPAASPGRKSVVVSAARPRRR